MVTVKLGVAVYKLRARPFMGLAKDRCGVARHRALARAKSAIYVAQHRNDFFSALGGKFQTLRNLLHAFQAGCVGVELRHARKIIKELDKQLWLMRQTPVRYGDTAHEVVR